MELFVFWPAVLTALRYRPYVLEVYEIYDIIL